jgi:hypothetical protein
VALIVQMHARALGVVIVVMRSGAVAAAFSSCEYYSGYYNMNMQGGMLRNCAQTIPTTPNLPS